MSSAVDICNMALANLGDSATVASIDPPEGSAQADHCARFYPQALSALLEMYPWSFCTRRALLAAVTNPSTTWQYAYALPAGCVNVLAIIASDATDDYSASLGSTTIYSDANGGIIPLGGVYTPQAFAVETTSAGDSIILTNQVDALARYTLEVTDSGKFPATFVETLAWLLASKLAGPVLKGDAGRAAVKDCMQMYNYWMKQATSSDAGSQRIIPEQQVSWLNAR